MIIRFEGTKLEKVGERAKMRPKDKVAIVTGSRSGIGREIVILFAEEGARVVVNGRSGSRGEEVANMIREAGREAIFVRADVSKLGEVRDLIRETVETYDRLDILVNNAANPEHERKPGADYSEEEWDKEMGITLRGAFLCCKYVIPEMLKAGGGNMVNVSSTSGMIGDRGLVAYDAAKGGMNMLTRALAIDYGPFGIRVDAVYLGAVDTPMAAYVREDLEKHKYTLSQVVLKRWAAPREIAYSVLFLSSDESSYVMGEFLVADGGWTIHH